MQHSNVLSIVKFMLAHFGVWFTSW